MTVDFVFKSAAELKTLHLARVFVRVIADHGEGGPTIFTMPPALQHCLNICRRIQALNTEEHPFVAFPMGVDSIQLVCHKATVAKLFRALIASQHQLGISVGPDLKSHVNLAAMDAIELQSVIARDLEQALVQQGWWALGEGHLLSLDPFATADGQPHICVSVEFQVYIQAPSTVNILLKPSTVRCRHPITPDAFECLDPVNYNTDSTIHKGVVCRVLPSLTPCIIHSLRPATDAEETFSLDLESAWRRAGWDLPAGAGIHIVNVRFDEDEDSPTVPFPSCAILSSLGFDPVDTSFSSLGVRWALGKLTASFEAIALHLWPSGSLKLVGARMWDSTAALAVNADSGFVTAKTVEGYGSIITKAPVRLGEFFDLDDVTTLDFDGPCNRSMQPTRKKQRAAAGPELRAYLARLEAEEADSALQETPAVRRTVPAPRAVISQKPGVSSQKKVVGGHPPSLLCGKRTNPVQAGNQAKMAKKPDVRNGKKTCTAKGTEKPVAAAKASLADVDVAAVARSGKLGSLTVPQLKAYCREIKLPVGGKKSELEARIRGHLGIPEQ